MLRSYHNLIISLVFFAIAAIAASFLSCAIVPKGKGIHVTNPMYIVGRIHKQWPEIKQITPERPGNLIIRNNRYYLPTPDEAWELIHEGFRVAKAPNGDEYNCVNYAVDTMFRVQKNYHGDGILAIGVLGYIGHMLNIIITTDGVLLYDAQDDMMEKPGPEIKPYFIWI